MTTIRERVLALQAKAEAEREEQRLAAEQDLQQNQVDRTKQITTNAQGETSLRTVESGGQGQIVPGQEDLFASAQSGGRETPIGSNIGDRFDAVTGGRISTGLVTQAQELQDRINSGTLNRFELEQAQKDLEGLQVSLQFGAHTGAPTTRVDELTGQVIRQELTGQEKLQKDRFMAAAEDAQRQGVGFTSTSASGFGVPDTFAQVQTTFTSPADRLTPAKNEDYTAFLLRQKTQKVQEVSEALSTALQDNNLKRAAELLKSRNDLQRPQLDPTREAKSKQKVLLDREAKEAREELATLRDTRDRELQEERDRLINDEFNRKRATLSVSSEGARAALEKQLKAQITAKYEKSYQDAKETLDAKFEGGSVTLDEEYAKSLKAIDDVTEVEAIELERANLQNTLLTEGFVTSPNKSKSTTTALLAFDTNQRDDILDMVRDGSAPNVDAAIAMQKEKNKYDLSSAQRKANGKVLDDIIATNADDITKFNTYYGDVGQSVEEAFKGFKSRFGEARAKQIKQEWLQSKGWDEQSIAIDDATDDLAEIYNGEVQGAIEVPALVQKLDSAGFTDEYIAAQLETIAESGSANPMAIATANALLTSYRPEVDRDIRTFGDELLEITDEGVNVLRTKAAQEASQRSTTPSTSTAVPEYQQGSAVTQEEVVDALSQFAPDIIADAEAIMNPVSALKLGDISQSKNRRAQVAQALNVMKDQAIASGDVLGIMKASAGGKEPDATTLQSFEKSLTVLSQLEELREQLEDQDTGPIVGILRSNNPFDVKARQIQAQLTSIIPNLARGTYGEVGVLTDNDVRLYQQTIPNLTSQKELSDALLGITMRTVQRGVENKIKLQAGLGRDMSGIQSIWSDVKEQSDRLVPSVDVPSVSTPQEAINGSIAQPSPEQIEFYSFFNELSEEDQNTIQNDPSYSQYFK